MLYLCGACGKPFPNAGMVADHVRAIHGQREDKAAAASGGREHVCPVCAESFGQKGDLKRHFQASHWSNL